MYRILAWLACTRFPVSFDLLPSSSLLFFPSPSSNPNPVLSLQFIPPSLYVQPPQLFSKNASIQPAHPPFATPSLSWRSSDGSVSHDSTGAKPSPFLTLSAPRLVIWVHKMVRVKVPLCAMRQRPGHKSALAAQGLHRVPFI